MSKLTDKIEVVFKSYDEGMNVIESLYEILNEDGVVFMGDLVDLVFPEQPYLKLGYENYGWNNLLTIKIEEYFGDNYVLTMPNLIKLK